MAFALAFFVVGIPYWLIPYNKINLPDALVTSSLLVVCAAALLLRFFIGIPFWKIVRIVGAAVPATVIARVVVECVQDPISHNLWPFEVVIAILVGFSCAASGSLIGLVLEKMLRANGGRHL